MKLTGKCKEDFDKWLYDLKFNNEKYDNLDAFSDLRWDDYPESMQSGVLIDFFDSKKYKGIKFFSYVFDLYYSIRIPIQTHNDIVVQSLEQCNKIHNESK